VIRLGDIDRLSAQLGEKARKGCRASIRSCGLPECMERGAEAIGWGRSARRSPGNRACARGVGMACTMQGSGIAGVDWASAFLKMNEDGSFYPAMGASDVGGAPIPCSRRSPPRRWASRLDKMIITSGDTDTTPFDVGAYASSTTIISGGAVKKAAEKVREQVLELASKMLDAPVET
jgi:putative selenate reductase molybdopterin-binding subunit